MARVLVVDDEPGVRAFLSGCLATEGHTVDEAANGAAALAQLRMHSYGLMFTDLKMPGMDGLTLVAAALAEHPDLETVVLTAHGTIEGAVQAMRLGAFDYLQKPVSGPAEVRLLAARALERRALRALRERAVRDDAPPRLSWGDPTMEAVVRQLLRVAATESTVLLLGESGVGKEVAARTLHARSARAEGPFVAINCATLSEQLLESELFGHERGAFTGATERKRGRLELASGGTFFLDEIGELRPPLQARLLRVLQERTFERVGGTQSVEVDLRWIAATNRNLTERIAAGEFRPDLYHRLAVFPLVLPPLRARRNDIVPLAESMLRRLAAVVGRAGLRLSAAARSHLTAASWPGNVRELANALERAAILVDGDEILPEHLILTPDGTSPAAAPADAAGQTLDELERRAIEDALAAVGGNRRQAAERLGIGLRTLYEKLRRYGLSQT